MVISGVGAGINELTALAGTAELAPTSKRGFYVSVLIFTIVPFCPSVMWAQLIATHSSWRYIGLLTSLWSFLGLVCVLVFYFPPPRVNSLGLSKREIIARIDFIGGFLSIAGIVLFVAGVLWGGYQVSFSAIFIISKGLSPNFYSVHLDRSAHSRPTVPWSPVPRPFRLLGDLGCKVSYGAETPRSS